MSQTENPSRGNMATRGSFEENIMALLDSTGIKQPRDLHDDRLSFLEAVRTSCLVAETPAAPSWNMCNATFQILRDSRSLELAMVSYQLLMDLDKCYPRVYIASMNELKNITHGITDLVVVNEAWSPFNVGPETAYRDGDGSSRNLQALIDPSSFITLVKDITQSTDEMQCQLVIKAVEDMLLFQYLVNVLEADFLPRQTLYKETLNWVFFRESRLNMLLVSRKLEFKILVKNCMNILTKQCDHQIGQDCDIAMGITVTELEKETCISAQKLLSLIMELDVIKKEADLNGVTSRVDGVRVPLLEMILDELTYNKDLISPFLVVFSESRWKLELVLQYFSRYCSKPFVRTRRLTQPLDTGTFVGILSIFSTPASTEGIVRKITPDVAQLLLAHAFQAFLSLQQDVKCFANFSHKIGAITLSMACKSLITAFKNLRAVDKNLDVTPFENEAHFTAQAILSHKA